MELSAHARSRRRLKAQRNANIHFLFGMPDTLEAEPLELSRTEIEPAGRVQEVTAWRLSRDPHTIADVIRLLNPLMPAGIVRVKVWEFRGDEQLALRTYLIDRKFSITTSF